MLVAISLEELMKTQNLEARVSMVEFYHSKVTELTLNIISESIYTQCDVDEIEYIWLDPFH